MLTSIATQAKLLDNIIFYCLIFWMFFDRFLGLLNSFFIFFSLENTQETNYFGKKEQKKMRLFSLPRNRES